MKDLNIKALSIKDVNAKKIKNVLQKITRFINKFRIPIAEFLNEGSRYKIVHIKITRFNSNDLKLGISLYIDGQTHYDLDDLTSEELQRCMNKLGSKVIVKKEQTGGLPIH